MAKKKTKAKIISSDIKVQQKRIKQFADYRIKKGFSANKIKQEIIKTYGVSASEIGLTYDTKTKKFRTYKNKKKLSDVTNIYREKQLKIAEKHEKALNAISENYTKKFLGSGKSLSEIMSLAPTATGKSVSWQDMNQEEFYQALQDVNKYAENFYLNNKEKEIEELEEDEEITKEDLELFKWGATLHGDFKEL